MSIKEAAKLLGVTEKTLREWDHSGKLKPQRTIGGHRRYNLQDIRKSTAEKSFFDSFSERDRTQNYRDIQVIHKYWVDKLPDELKQDSSLSVMLENYMLLNATTDDIGVPSEDMISLIIAVWGKMEIRQFISTQAALGPASLVFCANESEKGIKIDTSPVVAQTMRLDSCRYCKSLQIRDNLGFYSTIIAIRHSLSCPRPRNFYASIFDNCGREEKAIELHPLG